MQDLVYLPRQPLYTVARCVLKEQDSTNRPSCRCGLSTSNRSLGKGGFRLFRTLSKWKGHNLIKACLGISTAHT